MSRLRQLVSTLACLQLLCLLLILSSPAKASSGNTSGRSNRAYVPAEVILLNCGSSGINTAADHRKWFGDSTSKLYAPFLNGVAAAAPHQDPSLPSQVPYMTARIFDSPYTFTFPFVGDTARAFVRLYFYPVNYPDHKAVDSLFSVTTGNTILLRNFSAYQTAAAMNSAYLIREFSVKTTVAGLNLTFTPSNESPNSYAFVNGIEIVSTPETFPNTLNLVARSGRLVQFTLNHDRAFQTMYRLNVGGQAISPTGDSGLFRSWESDTKYIQGAAYGVTLQEHPNLRHPNPPLVPAYVAPYQVYATARSMGPNAQINLNYNLTWILPVDAGFYYIIRLHFCEIDYAITKDNQRVFYIYLNNLTAEQQADAVAWAGGSGLPTYKDYVIMTAGSGAMNVWVALHPNLNSGATFVDAILNGIEVFKLVNSGNSLAGLNPVLTSQPQQHQQPNEVGMNKSNHYGSNTLSAPAIVGSIVVVSLGISGIVALHRRQRRKKAVKNFGGSDDRASEWLPLWSMYSNSQSGAPAKTVPNICHHLTVEEIKATTTSEKLLLGIGGYEKVYSGDLAR